MNIKDIISFREIMAQGSLQRAATALGLTQPALTKCVQRLEDELQTRLFERGPSGMEPTRAALAFAAHASRLEGEYNAAMRAVGDLATAEAGTIRVGATPAWEYLVGEAYLRFLGWRPATRLQVSLMFSDRLLQSLSLGHIDFAIVTRSPALPADFEAHPLAHDMMRPIARRSHPLHRLEKLSLRDMHGHAWAAPRRGVQARDRLEEKFAQAGLPPPDVQVEFDGASIHCAFPFLAGRDLIGVCPASGLPAAASAGLFPLDAPELSWPMSPALILRRGSPLSPVASDFAARLMAWAHAG